MAGVTTKEVAQEEEESMSSDSKDKWLILGQFLSSDLQFFYSNTFTTESTDMTEKIGCHVNVGFDVCMRLFNAEISCSESIVIKYGVSYLINK